MISITLGCEYVVSSMTWHQWHHTAEMESRMGLPLSRASSNACFDQGCHLISDARFGRGEKWNSSAASAIRGTRLRSECDLNQRGRRVRRKELPPFRRGAEGAVLVPEHLQPRPRRRPARAGLDRGAA